MADMNPQRIRDAVATLIRLGADYDSALAASTPSRGEATPKATPEEQLRKRPQGRRAARVLGQIIKAVETGLAKIGPQDDPAVAAYLAEAFIPAYDRRRNDRSFDEDVLAYELRLALEIAKVPISRASFKKLLLDSKEIGEAGGPVRTAVCAAAAVCGCSRRSIDNYRKAGLAMLPGPYTPFGVAGGTLAAAWYALDALDVSDELAAKLVKQRRAHPTGRSRK